MRNAALRHARLAALAGPKDILWAALRASTTDRVSLAAAGCAFWGTIALFPAIGALISTYGLVFDPATIIAHLDLLDDLLPPPALELIRDRVQSLANNGVGQLSLPLLTNIAFALSGSAAGTKAMLSALNVVYDVQEQRGFIRFQLIGLGLTGLAIVAGVVGLIGVVVLPAILAFMGLAAGGAALIHLAGLAVVLCVFANAIALIYRVGPSRQRPPYAPVLPGAGIATLLWLIASAALSSYVSHIGRFGATYGPIGAVVGIMLWFYVSAYATLLGAEVNARLETRAG